MASKRKKSSRKKHSRKKRASEKKEEAAVASDARCHLDRIPFELFCLVTEKCGMRTRNLVFLSVTSRRYYEWTIPTVYKKHVKEHLGIAMYWAVANCRYNTLERLFENGANINLDEELHGLFEKVRKTRAYIQVKMWSYFSPLAWAAIRGQKKMVNYLLDHGANIEHPCSNVPRCTCSTDLLASTWYMPMCPEFIDGEEIDRYWWTPLHCAICEGHESAAKLLIARGASVKDLAFNSHRAKAYDVTALHVATRWGRGRIIDYLLNNKLVDISARTSKGITALHIAWAAREISLVDKYLDLGADINLSYEDKGRWTIFAMACADNRLDKALQYIRRGADPDFIISMRDTGPWTAMRCIYERGPQEKFSASANDKFALEREIIKVSGGKPSIRG